MQMIIDDQPIACYRSEAFRYDGETVAIFASGASITGVDFTTDLLATPSLFVNGSLSLLGQHHFTKVAGYVITDARFIAHNPEIIQHHYQGQPLFATHAVVNALAQKLPEIFAQYAPFIRLIHAVDRPLIKPHSHRTSRFFKLFQRTQTQKYALADFCHDRSFYIDQHHQPEPIGVSFDLQEGFVEAGTVAYVAAQLAYSMGATQIALYGVDLLNSQLPRFYEGKNAAPCKLDKAVENRIIPSFRLMKSQYALRGVAVINHSPVSKGLF